MYVSEFARFSTYDDMHHVKYLKREANSLRLGKPSLL